MARKFIPSGDSDFQRMASTFAQQLAREPERYHASAEEARLINDALSAFAAARQLRQNPAHRTSITRTHKDEARAETVRLIQDAANRIRADRSIDTQSRMMIGMGEKSERRRKRACPQSPPVLQFVASKAGGWNTPGMHKLKFFDRSQTQTSKAKPEGATRIELFRDLLLPGQPMPPRPDQRKGGWPEYERSFTRSPITVKYPELNGATTIIYWARWANATGEFGPYSQPLVASLDTWMAQPPSLPAPTEAQLEQRVTVTSARRELPDCVETFQTMTAERSKRLPPPQRDAA